MLFASWSFNGFWSPPLFLLRHVILMHKSEDSHITLYPYYNHLSVWILLQLYFIYAGEKSESTETVLFIRIITGVQNTCCSFTDIKYRVIALGWGVKQDMMLTCTSKSGSVSQSSPSDATFTLTLWPTTDFHIYGEEKIIIKKPFFISHTSNANSSLKRQKKFKAAVSNISLSLKFQGKFKAAVSNIRLSLKLQSKFKAGVSDVSSSLKLYSTFKAAASNISLPLKLQSKFKVVVSNISKSL